MASAQIQVWQRALGVVADGDFGPATLAASMLLLPGAAPPKLPASATSPSLAYPRQADMVAFYGPAGGPACTAGKVYLPMPFTIAWNTAQTIRVFSCHTRLAAPFTAIFQQAFEHYGAAQMTALGLDMFGGCYNLRAMRGGTSLSMHSWGAAVDMDPERNTLTMDHTQARFARPEYLPFWEIVERNGAVSLGRVRDIDWMHFQFARLNT